MRYINKLQSAELSLGEQKWKLIRS
jgi:hypothetical protein